jgi:hypothetical protein
MKQPNPVSEKAGVTFQPPCKKCGEPMWLVRLSPLGNGEDLREFECQVCEISESMIVKFQ